MGWESKKAVCVTAVGGFDVPAADGLKRIQNDVHDGAA